MTIPKIIHQIWLSRDGKDVENLKRDLKKTYYINIKKVQELNEDYEYMWWTNSTLEKLFDFPELKKYKDIWLNMKPHICRCDFVRYAIMYHYGGVYFDLDFKFTRELPEFDPTDKIIFSHEPTFQLDYFKENISKISGLKTSLANNVLISESRNLFWLGLMDRIVQYYLLNGPPITSHGVVELTGPKMISDYVDSIVGLSLPHDIKILTETSTFFNHPPSPNSVSYNDWRDGTNWVLYQLMEFQKGQCFLIVVGFVILTLIMCIFLIFFLSIYRMNQNRSRNAPGVSLLMSEDEQKGFHGWYKKPRYLSEHKY